MKLKKYNQLVKEQFETKRWFNLLSKLSKQINSRRGKNMSINCDVCKKDLTPNSQGEKVHSFVSLQDRKFCLCPDCQEVILTFILSEDCKKKSLDFQKDFN